LSIWPRFCPACAEASRAFLDLASLNWESRYNLMLNHRINAFTPLMTRVEKDKVQAMVDASKDNLTATVSRRARQGGSQARRRD
jgi:methionyl-tRNA synthetase